MTKAGPTETDPRIERTKSRVYEATRELAGDTGFHACTFEAISERSGVARSTLYRHWANQADLVMAALKEQHVERIVPDTGNLRDDMLVAMLELGSVMEHSSWGCMIPQLVAAAFVDDELAAIQAADSQHHLAIDAGIIDRAKARGEISGDVDSAHAAMLFSSPIFYRHLVGRQPIDARWITAHVDTTVDLMKRATTP